MAQKISPLQTLKIPLFRNYLTGSFLSEIGNQMQIVAVAWQVYEMTRNPIYLGLIGVVNFLPIIFFSLVGGVVADRADRRKLLLVSHIIQAFLALFLFILSTFSLINTGLIYLILFLIATTQSFSVPVRLTIVPHLVPRKYFMSAVSLSSLQYQVAILLGPAIAGFLIGGAGVSVVYFINAISFLFFIVAILSLNIPLKKETKEEVELNFVSIWEGIKFVLATPILYTTMIVDFLATFFGTANMLMPVFAKDVLHVGASGLGLLYSAPAVGGVIAGLLVAALHHKIPHQGYAILGAVILYGIATIAFGLSGIFPLSLIFLTFVGFGDMISTIIRNTIRQMVTPDRLMGRMASVLRIFFQGGPQLGEIEAGFLAKLIGAPASVVVGGVGVILITVLIFIKSKALRNFDGKDLTA